MSVVQGALQVAKSMSRHDGHCDEATPDERAPFRVWSFLFSEASRKAKGPGKSRASAFF
jgi:hypothetical protein